MLAIPVFIFVGGDLGLHLVDGHVDAAVEIFAVMRGDEAVVMFGGNNDFSAFHFGFGTVQDDFDFLDQVVKLGEFVGFFLRVLADGGRDIQVTTGNCYDHVKLLLFPAHNPCTGPLSPRPLK